MTARLGGSTGRARIARLGFPGRRSPRDPAACANVARGLQAVLPWRDPGRRKPDVVYLGRNPLLALGDIGRRTSDPELRTVTVNSLWGRR